MHNPRAVRITANTHKAIKVSTSIFLEQNHIKFCIKFCKMFILDDTKKICQIVAESAYIDYLHFKTVFEIWTIVYKNFSGKVDNLMRTNSWSWSLKLRLPTDFNIHSLNTIFSWNGKFAVERVQDLVLPSFLVLFSVQPVRKKSNLLQKVGGINAITESETSDKA